jgi:hypothetical protein
MTPPDPAAQAPPRCPTSLDVDFVEALDAAMGLATPSRERPTAPGEEIGIDQVHLPAQLAAPHRHPSWQSSAVRRQVAEAEAWSGEFLADVEGALREELHRRYWWLWFLRKLLVDPKLEGRVAPHRDTARVAVAQLYLRGEPAYVAAEQAARRRFYDAYVRLVYGGGARNNAELFLPTWRTGKPSWEARPGFEEIVQGPGAALLRALEQNPGVGLVFVRRQNGAIAPGEPLPERLEIRVSDRLASTGTITVRRDRETGVLLFHYRVDPDSPEDPLGYGALGRGEGTWGTYREWNEWSLRETHALHNVVAGMGAYLYSTNPTIGDVSVTHAEGWNFGGNAAGHGGLQRGEKLTAMLVSGPGIRPGELRAITAYRSRSGEVVPEAWLARPTLLDAAPTVLAWLGHGDTALEDFARRGFAGYWARWVAGQRADILSSLDDVENLNQALREAGFSELRISRFRGRLERLLDFLPREPPVLPEAGVTRVDGSLLELD